VGPPEKYDLIGAMQFNLLTTLGLREHHFLLDVGCGSLRAGRLFIPYLLSGHYFGIEPNKWLIEEGLKNEVGEDILLIKEPRFSYDSNFTLTIFGQKFDYIVANSIFSHTPIDSIRRILSEARKTMNQASIFAADVRFGKTDYEGDKWAYPEGVDYTEKTFANLVSESGLSFRKFGWKHKSKKTWVGIVKPGNEKSVEGIRDYFVMKRTLDKLESSRVFRLGRKTYKLLH
jgi:methyltransferase family protein